QLGQRRGRNEAALVVARLGPWIGIEQIDRVDRCIGQRDQKFQRIIGKEPDIADAPSLNSLHHLADAAGEDFATDKAGVWLLLGFARQVFATAIADLDDDLVSIGKEAF